MSTVPVCPTRVKPDKLGTLAYKGNTGLGCDGFHPKVLLDLAEETRREVVGGILGEGGAEWEMDATSLHNYVLPDPKNVTSERPDCALCLR